MTLISVEQAAKVLGVSRTTAYRMVNDHLIPTVRFMKRGIRVHAEKLQEMIDAEADASIAPAPLQNSKPKNHDPNKRLDFAKSISHAEMEREFNELLALAKIKRKGR